ncbi:MAG TPA: Fe(3+) ABC transporter substrate-binding protein [Bacteroidales bacterium]|nr:Fe(3+) ABC transporter substrate-binding protein [Bacteroidales bacterium]
MRNLFFLGLMSILFFGCAPAVNEVNVYSGRHYEIDEVLFAEFYEETGIKVNVIKADADQLISRMELEGSASPADLLFTVDAGRLVLADQRGLLQSFESSLVDELVPLSYRDAGGKWVGLTSRARVFVYHKDKVNPADLSTYEALADPRWRGQILVRTSQNQYNQTLMASMIAALGAEKAEEWSRALVANFARSPQGNDRDQVKAVAAGAGSIAIVNTYYVGLLHNSEIAEERALVDNLGIFFPNQGDRGTHINISGVGLAAHAPNRENAIKLIEFLLSDHAQQLLANSNFEYPVSSRVPWPTLVQQWGEFKADTLQLSDLRSYLQEAMFIFDRTGWK